MTNAAADSPNGVPLNGHRTRRRLRRLAEALPPREGLRHYTQTSLRVTDAMSQLMAELMGLDEPEGAIQRPYYLPLNGLGTRQQADLQRNLEAVQRRGLPDFLEVAQIGDIGYGIFLRSGGRSLVRGTTLGIYMGQLRIITDDDYDAREGPMITYEYDLDGPLELARWQFDALQRDGYIAGDVQWYQDEQFWLTVDACHEGNWTRLVNGTSKAAANIEAEIRKLRINGKLLFAPVLRVRKSIKPGEQLLLDYGPQYWTTLGIRPRIVHPDSWMLSKDANS